MASPFTVLLATQWVLDGTASDMLAAIRAESNARQAMASRVLAGWHFDADRDGFHLWLPLARDSDWQASELAMQLRTRGIGAVSAAAFATDGNPPEAVRVCLGGPKSLDECEDALRMIADTLEHPHHLHSPVM
jgi:DNA-binding transcriptional MocR family regulator